MAKETAVFSYIKRMFGEYTSDIRFQNMIKEMTKKVSLYNLLEELYNIDENNLRKTSYTTKQIFTGLGGLGVAPAGFSFDKDLYQSFVNKTEAFKEKVEQVSI